MKERYYYLRINKIPVVTVCLLENDEGEVSRGVAICSPNDNPCKKIGRAVALARARKANGMREDHPINLAMMQERKWYLSGFSNQGLAVYGTIVKGGGISRFYQFNPVLSPMELRILKREPF